LLIKALAVEAACLVGFIVYQAGRSHQLTSVAKGIVCAEGQGQFIEIAVLDYPVSLGGIITGGINPQFTYRVRYTEIGSSVAPVAAFGLQFGRKELRRRLRNKVDCPAYG